MFANGNFVLSQKCSWMHGCFVREPPIHSFPPQLLFLFADSRGLKDTAQWQEAFPPVKVITKRSCSYCHRAQGPRTARRTSFATSLPSQQNTSSVHLPKGRAIHFDYRSQNRRQIYELTSITILSLKPTNTSFTNFTSLAMRWYMHVIPALPRFLRITRPIFFVTFIPQLNFPKIFCIPDYQIPVLCWDCNH